jgi:hypothetical protein
MKNKGIVIMGSSGSGKSTSIRTLDPKSTFIINVVGKDFPFKGKGYKSIDLSKGPPKDGNLAETDDFKTIVKTLRYVNESRPEIKTIVLDDMQYIFANEFMRRIDETGFKKFNSIGFNIWSLAMETRNVREDLIIFLLTHSEENMTVTGEKYTKVKTLGKLVDDKVTFEGLFTVVLQSQTQISKSDGIKYGFLTKGDGISTVKTPIDMFEEDFIPNDLNLVRTKYLEYYND